MSLSNAIRLLTISAFVTWVLGASLTAAVFFSGLVRIALLTRRAKPFVCASFRMSRRIRVLLNDGTILGTCGIFRPRVFLPCDAGRWSGDRLRVVLT
jgi:hypothetical protein